MQEREISIKDMLFCALRKWRKIVIIGIIVAILMGSFVAATRAIDMKDPKKIEMWQNEYDVAYGSYWAAINNVDRLIAENERLASQVELEIERLNIKKTNYEANLQNIMADIAYYEALIEDYRANIKKLDAEKERLEYYLEYRKAQNENSLLMNIDPYDVNVYEVYLRVDSGYEILPGNVFQNVDPTSEIIQTYCLLINNTGFYNKLITDLNFDTEVRYLTEVVSIGAYGDNSVRVRVISNDKAWAKEVAEYMSDAIEASHNNVELSIAEHELVKYNTNSYSVVDLGTYATQQSNKQEVLNYESSIRSVEMSVMQVEESIRDLNNTIRLSNQEIDEIEIAITEIPLAKKALNDQINSYNDANYELKSNRIELLKNPKPEYQGYTVQSIIVGFIKFAVIGGVIGVIIAAIYIAVMGIMNGRVLSSEQVSYALNSKFFGYWPKTGKKKFAFVDRWIDRMYSRKSKDMTPERATNLVLSNVAVACDGISKIMLCGGANKETIDGVACAIKEQLSDVDIISGSTIDVDPDVVRGVSECDAVILVEQLDKSDLNAAAQIKDQLDKANKPILGVILS